LFEIDNSCTEDCDFFKKFGEKIKGETTAWCANLDDITDEALQKCLADKCVNGKISCLDPMDKCGNGQDWAAYSWKGSDTTYLCTSGFGKYGSPGSYVGDTIIHEWSHGCGWNHGDGQGVPPEP
jgi:hypothetical protein